MISLLLAAALACAQPTPLGELELAAVLRDGHHAVFGRFPSRQRLASAWAHVALESGRGARSCSHNIGSIGARGDAPAYVIAGARFAVEPSFRDGAEAYWRTLRRCTSALGAFDSGDVRYAAVRLARCGYHRSDVDTYGDALAGLAWQGRVVVGRL